MRSKYDEKRLCALARELGRKGLCVSEAAARMGVATATFSSYERRFPKFKAAAAQIRENSAKWATLRFARLLGKTEAELLKALAHVRERREKTLREYRARFGAE